MRHCILLLYYVILSETSMPTGDFLFLIDFFIINYLPLLLAELFLFSEF